MNSTIHKPELIVLATLLLLAGVSVASAADMQMISVDDFAEYITSQALMIFGVILLLSLLYGLSLLLFGSSRSTAKGYAIIAAVFLVIILYFLVPGFFSKMESIATTTTIDFDIDPINDTAT